MTELDESGRIFKQISIPTGLEGLLGSLSYEILKKQPDDLYSFARKHFEKLLILRDIYGIKIDETDKDGLVEALYKYDKVQQAFKQRKQKEIEKKQSPGNQIPPTKQSFIGSKLIPAGITVGSMPLLEKPQADEGKNSIKTAEKFTDPSISDSLKITKEPSLESDKLTTSEMILDSGEIVMLGNTTDDVEKKFDKSINGETILLVSESIPDKNESFAETEKSTAMVENINSVTVNSEILTDVDVSIPISSEGLLEQQELALVIHTDSKSEDIKVSTSEHADSNLDTVNELNASDVKDFSIVEATESFTNNESLTVNDDSNFAPDVSISVSTNIVAENENCEVSSNLDEHKLETVKDKDVVEKEFEDLKQPTQESSFLSESDKDNFPLHSKDSLSEKIVKVDEANHKVFVASADNDGLLSTNSGIPVKEETANIFTDELTPKDAELVNSEENSNSKQEPNTNFEIKLTSCDGIPHNTFSENKFSEEMNEAAVKENNDQKENESETTNSDLNPIDESVFKKMFTQRIDSESTPEDLKRMSRNSSYLQASIEKLNEDDTEIEDLNAPNQSKTDHTSSIELNNDSSMFNEQLVQKLSNEGLIAGLSEKNEVITGNELKTHKKTLKNNNIYEQNKKKITGSSTSNEKLAINCPIIPPKVNFKGEDAKSKKINESSRSLSYTNPSSKDVKKGRGLLKASSQDDKINKNKRPSPRDLKNKTKVQSGLENRIERSKNILSESARMLEISGITFNKSKENVNDLETARNESAHDDSKNTSESNSIIPSGSNTDFIEQKTEDNAANINLEELGENYQLNLAETNEHDVLSTANASIIEDKRLEENSLHNTEEINSKKLSSAGMDNDSKEDNKPQENLTTLNNDQCNDSDQKISEILLINNEASNEIDTFQKQSTVDEPECLQEFVQHCPVGLDIVASSNSLSEASGLKKVKKELDLADLNTNQNITQDSVSGENRIEEIKSEISEKVLEKNDAEITNDLIASESTAQSNNEKINWYLDHPDNTIDAVCQEAITPEQEENIIEKLKKIQSNDLKSKKVIHGAVSTDVTDAIDSETTDLINEVIAKAESTTEEILTRSKISIEELSNSVKPNSDIPTDNITNDVEVTSKNPASIAHEIVGAYNNDTISESKTVENELNSFETQEEYSVTQETQVSTYVSVSNEIITVDSKSDVEASVISNLNNKSNIKPELKNNAELDENFLEEGSIPAVSKIEHDSLMSNDADENLFKLNKLTEDASSLDSNNKKENHQDVKIIDQVNKVGPVASETTENQSNQQNNNLESVDQVKHTEESNFEKPEDLIDQGLKSLDQLNQFELKNLDDPESLPNLDLKSIEASHSKKPENIEDEAKNKEDSIQNNKIKEKHNDLDKFESVDRSVYANLENPLDLSLKSIDPAVAKINLTNSDKLEIEVVETQNPIELSENTKSEEIDPNHKESISNISGKENYNSDNSKPIEIIDNTQSKDNNDSKNKQTTQNTLSQKMPNQFDSDDRLVSADHEDPLDGIEPPEILARMSVGSVYQIIPSQGGVYYDFEKTTKAVGIIQKAWKQFKARKEKDNLKKTVVAS